MPAANELYDDRPREERRASGDFQRHSRNGAPYVNHPTQLTKKGLPARVMYGRCSNFGPQIESRFNLERWTERRVLLGAARINLAGVEELDPDDEDQALQLDGLVGDAKRAAGAHLAAMRGTLTHTFTEYVEAHEESPVAALAHGEELGLTKAAIDATMDAFDRLRTGRGLHTLATEADGGRRPVASGRDVGPDRALRLATCSSPTGR